jgi:hypothetical protein
MPVAPQPPPQGQWVNTAEYGWIWIPAGATPYAVAGVPYVYLYTPTYGWTWYASPWGWGPYAYGPWVSRPWPFGFRVWHHGPRGWGWHVGPHVSLHFGAYPRWRGHGHPHHYGHHHRGHGGHRGSHRRHR